MVKYIFRVFDRDTGDQISQLVTDCDHMLETLEVLNKLGMVKGFILDDEKEIKNDL